MSCCGPKLVWVTGFWFIAAPHIWSMVPALLHFGRWFYALRCLFKYVYCKTHFFRVPFISRISRAWQVCENNGPQKFEYSSVSV